MRVRRPHGGHVHLSLHACAAAAGETPMGCIGGTYYTNACKVRPARGPLLLPLPPAPFLLAASGAAGPGPATSLDWRAPRHLAGSPYARTLPQEGLRKQDCMTIVMMNPKWLVAHAFGRAPRTRMCAARQQGAPGAARIAAACCAGLSAPGRSRTPQGPRLRAGTHKQPGHQSGAALRRLHRCPGVCARRHARGRWRCRFLPLGARCAFC